MQPLVQLLLLIIGCYFLSFQIMHSLANVSGKYTILRLLLLPGVVLHESAHALACFFTGTHIETISFWTETGGHVIHHKPKLAVVTQPIISLAPFPVGIITLVSLSHVLTHTNWLGDLLIIWLMLSIAATLAPSSADLVLAIEGAIVVSGLSVVLFYIFPTALEHISQATSGILSKMQLVTLILGLIWIILLILHHSRRRVRTR